MRERSDCITRKISTLCRFITCRVICRLSTCRVTATNRKKTEISTSKLVLSGQGRRCSEGNTCPDRKRGKRCPDSVCDCIGQEHFCRENSAEKRESIRIAKERDLNDKNRLVAQTLPRNLKRLFLFSLEISLSPAPFRHLSYRRATTVFNFGLKSSSKLPEIFLKNSRFQNVNQLQLAQLDSPAKLALSH